MKNWISIDEIIEQESIFIKQEIFDFETRQMQSLELNYLKSHNNRKKITGYLKLGEKVFFLR